jgi:hypothetical protein
MAMREEMRWDNHDAKTGDKHEIIASATIGSVWYAALKITRADAPDAPIVTALVCLTSKGGKRDGFGHKDMDETVGPVECSCPERILNLLTPTDSEYANDWRNRCREWKADQAKLKTGMAKLAPGVKIRMPEPLSYRGVMLDTFTIASHPRVRGLVGYAEGGVGLYRIPAAAAARATIITA